MMTAGCLIAAAAEQKRSRGQSPQGPAPGARGRADQLVPTAGIFKDNAAFFRRGISGAGREILSIQELAGYRARVAQLAPPDLIAWLHRDRRVPAA